MAGAKLTPFGADVRKLIRETLESGGNPTMGTLKDELAKLSKKHGDKKNEGQLQSFFNSHKIAVAKQDGKSEKPAKTNGKKRGRPAGSTKVARTNGHEIGNGLDLAIDYAKAAGGLDKAIATLNQLKAIKESI